MWVDYYTKEELGSRINGISKKASIDAAKSDGGYGVVIHPKTEQRMYWDGK